MTEDDIPGRLTVSGGDLNAPREFTSVPVAPAIIQGYDSRERDQAAENGYPLFRDGSWKHSIVIDGLTPGTRYDYSAAQASSTFESTFQIPPTADEWSSIRFIVMSDSETEPRGRTNKRDWSLCCGQNMRIVNKRSPDVVMMPEDLVQGGGYQQGWAAASPSNTP